MVFTHSISQALLSIPPVTAVPHDWSEAGIEPSVHDLLRDPLVKAVMDRDALTCGDIQAVIELARQQLAASPYAAH